jgi:hypothetical protein
LFCNFLILDHHHHHHQKQQWQQHWQSQPIVTSGTTPSECCIPASHLPRHGTGWIFIDALQLSTAWISSCTTVSSKYGQFCPCFIVAPVPLSLTNWFEHPSLLWGNESLVLQPQCRPLD